MSTLPLNAIINQNCRIGLKAFPDNYFDCCVTDPPYGIRFMNKKWDYKIPSVLVWEEVLRVLKPGAHILVACGTRTQHRMAVNIEDAGFEIRDVICWHYGSGFPKSMDISKAMDSRGGQNISWFGDFLRYWRTERKISQRELCEKGGWYDKVNHGGAVTNWELGYNLPTPDQFIKLIEILDLPTKNMEAAHREVIGMHQKDMGGLGGSRLGKTGGDITLPATEAAKQWDGWGTALKPATEFWTLARKPLSEKTIAQNVIKHGTGGINIEDCRIPFQSPEDKKSATFGTGTSIIGGNYAGGDHTLDHSRKNIEADDAGRFPANLILDDFMAGEMDRQTGTLTSGQPTGKRKAKNNIYGQYAPGQDITGYGDAGGASRFFYVAKPSPEERGDSKHPTIKPQTLIQYLIKLICPIEPGRIVLEPFAGSGSHCLAARKLGLDFVGFELEEHSCTEANERLIKEMGLFL